MSANTTTQSVSKPLAPVAEALRLFQSCLSELGLSVSVWDAQGQPFGRLPSCSEFCRAVLNSSDTCRESQHALAREVLSASRSRMGLAPCGGRAVGAPIHRRRKLLGAAVACFPVRQMLDEETLARTCGRLGLDREHVRPLAQSACHLSEEHAGRILKALRWMIETAQSAQVAREELASLSANLSSTYEELSLLYRISGAMSVTRRSQEFLQTVCAEVLEVMGIAGVAVVLAPEAARDEGEGVVLAGEVPLEVAQVQALVRERFSSAPGQPGEAVLDNAFACPLDRPAWAGVRNFVAIPLASPDAALGVLVGFNKQRGEFDSVDLKLITSIGGQVSVFLANRRLYAQMQDLLLGVLHALTAAIDAKDPYTRGHSQRVALLSRKLAEAMGFSPARADRVYLCGVLHDIGKIGIPESILCKDGRLSAEEYGAMQRHPDVAARILGGIRQMRDVVEGIRTHHERPDGRGYPRGLKGPQIPVEGLIVGLADSFDAMTSDRTYRQAMRLEGAAREIAAYAGTQFDAGVAKVLLSMDLEALKAEVGRSAEKLEPIHRIGETHR